MQQNFIQDSDTGNQDPMLKEYFRQHKSKTNQRLHIIGIGLALLILIHAVFTFDIFQLIYVPIFALGFSYVGHKMFQGNQSCTNVDSFTTVVIANLMIIKDIATRKRSF